MVTAESSKTSAATGSTATQALEELTPATAPIGAWYVRVHKAPEVIPYTYKYQGQQRTSSKMEVILIGQQAESYCIGRARRPIGAKDDSALHAIGKKFAAGSIWKITRVALINDNKQYLGCSVKVVVDLAKTTFSSVLQATVPMPMEPAPVEQLSDIVSVKVAQRCDVTCLLESVSREAKTRNTEFGPRRIVDVCICDGSKDGENFAKLSTNIWLPDNATGTSQMAQLANACDKKQPISMFGLIVSPDAQSDGHSCRPSREFWWMVCAEAQSTAKVLALRENGEEILSASDTMKELATQWSPLETVDYSNKSATRLTVQLLQAIVHREKAALPDSEEGGYVLFQLNCVRLIEPAIGEEVRTNDGARLFVPVRVIDDWGQITLRMREPAALQATGLESAEEFEKAVRAGELRFPILSSVRVRVQRSKTSNDAGESLIDAIIVDTEQQSTEEDCRPNASLVPIAKASKPLGYTSAHMLVGSLSEITKAPHAGLSVGGITCECALVLCAIKGTSQIEQIGAGHRVVTKGLHEVTHSSGNSGQLSERAVPGQFVSMCTLSNLTQFTLTPSNPKGFTYCLALISNVIITSREGNSGASDVTFIVDRVSTPLQVDDRVAYLQLLDEMAKLAKIAKPNERAKRSAEWAQETASALNAAKKARALSREPTNTPLPDPQPSVASES